MMADNIRVAKRDRRLLLGAVFCAAFAVALVSVGTYRLSSAPVTATEAIRPSLRTAVTPAVSTPATTDIQPNSHSHGYALFLPPERYGAAYPGFVPYSEGPGLRVDMPALDLQSLLPANAAATANRTLTAPPALPDLTAKIETPATLSANPLPQSPVAARPAGDLTGGLNPATPALAAPAGLIRR
jgi:hypothetical protein